MSRRRKINDSTRAWHAEYDDAVRSDDTGPSIRFGTHYDTLHVTADATTEEVNIAFVNLALECLDEPRKLFELEAARACLASTSRRNWYKERFSDEHKYRPNKLVSFKGVKQSPLWEQWLLSGKDTDAPEFLDDFFSFLFELMGTPDLFDRLLHIVNSESSDQEKKALISLESARHEKARQFFQEHAISSRLTDAALDRIVDYCSVYIGRNIRVSSALAHLRKTIRKTKGDDALLSALKALVFETYNPIYPHSFATLSNFYHKVFEFYQCAYNDQLPAGYQWRYHAFRDQIAERLATCLDSETAIPAILKTLSKYHMNPKRLLSRIACPFEAAIDARDEDAINRYVQQLPSAEFVRWAKEHPILARFLITNYPDAVRAIPGLLAPLYAQAVEEKDSLSLEIYEQAAADGFDFELPNQQTVRPSVSRLTQARQIEKELQHQQTSIERRYQRQLTQLYTACLGQSGDDPLLLALQAFSGDPICFSQSWVGSYDLFECVWNFYQKVIVGCPTDVLPFMVHAALPVTAVVENQFAQFTNQQVRIPALRQYKRLLRNAVPIIQALLKVLKHFELRYGLGDGQLFTPNQTGKFNHFITVLVSLIEKNMEDYKVLFAEAEKNLVPTTGWSAFFKSYDTFYVEQLRGLALHVRESNKDSCFFAVRTVLSYRNQTADDATGITVLLMNRQTLADCVRDDEWMNNLNLALNPGASPAAGEANTTS